MSAQALKVEWWNINFHEVDQAGNTLNTGCILDIPRKPEQDVNDLSEQQIRFHVGYEDEEGWIEQECIGPKGYYFSDGAGLHDTSTKVSRISENSFHQQIGICDVTLTFEQGANGIQATLTHKWPPYMQDEPNVRIFQQSGPARKI